MNKEDLHNAMLNSYDIIVKDYDAGLIMEQRGAWFAHDIYNPIDIDDIEGLIMYFEDEEDYEKCLELKKVIDRIWNTDPIN